MISLPKELIIGGGSLPGGGYSFFRNFCNKSNTFVAIVFVL